jgi:flagellar FliL protein
MAKKPTKTPEAEAAPAAEPAAKPKKKKRSLLTIVIPLAVVAGGGGGAWYAFAPDASAKAEVPVEKAPVFVNLEPFTVNLQPQQADQYLQVGLVVKVTDPAAADAIKLHMPEIRNRVLLLLTSKTAGDLSTTKGKEQLGAEIVNEIKQPIKKSADDVSSVYFTSFVIQ